MGKVGCVQQVYKLSVCYSPQNFFQEFSDQHPENAAEIKLTMAQLKISQGT